MKIAIMQPYFFPYIGYWELMRSVNLFVFLTDVQYIRQGWVNRNRIKSQHEDSQYITVPVQNCARDTKIKDVQVVPGWEEHICKTLLHQYGKHPAIDLVQSLGWFQYLNWMLQDSIKRTSAWLDIPVRFADSDGISNNTGAQRLLDICRHYGADTYVNLPGGKELYTQADFEEIKLEFMEPTAYTNKLSILDLLITEEKQVKEWLNSKIFCPGESLT